MTRSGNNGVTLIELIVAITVLSGVAVTAAALLSICLKAHAYGTGRSELHEEGFLAMERMTSGVSKCTFLLIPNAHSPTRDILAFSGGVNDDNDFYFNDPLFPRIDEDSNQRLTDDGAAGIVGLDDDGDGSIDEGTEDDDDEDGWENEDVLDGVDNDGDGNIDEDVEEDMNDDGRDGIRSMDDDGDGDIDEDDKDDDDEDGTKDEDSVQPVIYTFDSGINTLQERLPLGGTVDLSTQVTNFSATYDPPDATHDPRVLISLTLTGDNGESVAFSEYVYPENIVQKCGRRVR